METLTEAETKALFDKIIPEVRATFGRNDRNFHWMRPLFMDGNMWCALQVGCCLADGRAAFGPTPEDAMRTYLFESHGLTAPKAPQ